MPHRSPKEAPEVITLALDPCRLCGRSGHATVTIEDYGSCLRTRLWCHGCGSGWEPSYAAVLAGDLDVPLRELLSDPLRYLEDYTLPAHHRAAKAAKPAAPLPDVAACAERLRADPRRMRHLTVERGLWPETVAAHSIGWDGRSYLMPVSYDGIVQTVVRYRPRRTKRRYVALAGRGSCLYPEMPHGRAVVLVAGMMCALIGRQHGLPAVTTTCGKTLPDRLAMQFTNRRVAVIYDVGEEASAERSVRRLMPYAASAWVVPLPLPEPGSDVADWFAKHKRSADDLLDVIREARP